MTDAGSEKGSEVSVEGGGEGGWRDALLVAEQDVTLLVKLLDEQLAALKRMQASVIGTYVTYEDRILSLHQIIDNMSHNSEQFGRDLLRTLGKCTIVT